MKSFIITGNPWIYLLYCIVSFIISIYGLIQGDIEGIGVLLFFCLPLLFLFFIKMKTYIKFSNEKIYVNMQKKWYSMKMYEEEIDINNIDSIEICKTAQLGVRLFVCFFLLLFPILFWRICHRKFIIHKKTGEILHLRITPIGYNNTVKMFLLQYAKEKGLKIVSQGETEYDNIEGQGININDLLKSVATCDYIDVETPNENIQKNKNQSTKENVKLNNSVSNDIKGKKGYMICPFCANEIKKGARKCQYCHEFLDEENIKNKINAYSKNSGN